MAVPPGLPPIYSSIPLASVAIRDLVLDTASDTEEYYQFFELVLTPGSFRRLCITVWDSEAFLRLQQFLRSGVAQDLRSISVDILMLRCEDSAYSVSYDTGDAHGCA